MPKNKEEAERTEKLKNLTHASQAKMGRRGFSTA